VSCSGFRPSSCAGCGHKKCCACIDADGDIEKKEGEEPLREEAKEEPRNEKDNGGEVVVAEDTVDVGSEEDSK
jgi:hypothetical protein